ncbi:MAG: lysophospholipid acyltransferase family protein [Verrucomicrobiae bacterium]|nr:lysophospholipid acyltransferase family protein [Verrucomicrobiae bacterium]
MNAFFLWVLRASIAGLRCLPLWLVAGLGRAGGQVAWWVDGRHRRVAIGNLQRVFGRELSNAAIRSIARENYLRIATNYFSLIKIAAMPAFALEPHLEWRGMERLTQPDGRCGILAIGHFGNFELFERLPSARPDLRFISTYRALRQPVFNSLMQEFRTRWGVQFFERRSESDAMKAALSTGSSWLVLLADQHAGPKGAWLPFLGHACSCSVSPALFALRYRRPLLPAFCFQVSPLRWRIEVGEEIPVHEGGRRRSVEAVTRDLNAAYEAAVRRDPANWFWVHRRWKPASPAQVKASAGGGNGTSLVPA